MFFLSIIKNLTRYETNGYYQYYIPDHHLASKSGLVYEHQLVAEEKLGRKLHPGEVVHHIDRNRKNNDMNNLMIFKTNADYVAYHAGKEIT